MLNRLPGSARRARRYLAARGDLLTRNASGDARLPLGTSGFQLQSDGTDVGWAGFLQAGTGAVTRTWQVKAREFVSVKDFGAVGDNTTNDAAAIQDAIDYASANGAAIFFPPGAYLCNSALTISDNTGSLQLIGASPPRYTPIGVEFTSTLRFAAGVSGIVADEASNSRIGGVTLKNLTIYKGINDNKGSGTVGLNMLGARGWVVEDVMINGFDINWVLDDNSGSDTEAVRNVFNRVVSWNAATYCAEIGGAADTRLEGCWFGGDSGTLDALLNIRDGANTHTPDALHFSRCQFIPSTGQTTPYGIKCDESDEALWITLDKCVFEDCDTAGVYFNKSVSTFDETSRVTLWVRDCWFDMEGNARGIHAINTSCVLSSNRINVQGTSNICGIKVEATSGPKALTAVITGNTIGTNNASGGFSIELNGLDGAVVVHNTFKEGGTTPASNGIVTDANCSNCILFPNNDRTGGSDSIAGSGHLVSFAGGALTLGILLRAIAGAAGAPSYSFAGDTNTGMYSSSADLLEFATGGTRRAFIDGGQLSTTGVLQALSGTAVPAGGTAGAGLKVSSTANFGIFFGSGAPTLSAAQGSLYLQSDGSSTSTRLHVRTASGWTNVVTAT